MSHTPQYLSEDEAREMMVERNADPESGMEYLNGLERYSTEDIMRFIKRGYGR